MKCFAQCDGSIGKARDLLFRILPNKIFSKIKHHKTEDILNGMYDLVQFIPREDPPVFVAPDSNNILFINLRNVDRAVLVFQQIVLKAEFASMLDEQKLIEITTLLY